MHRWISKEGKKKSEEGFKKGVEDARMKSSKHENKEARKQAAKQDMVRIQAKKKARMQAKKDAGDHEMIEGGRKEARIRARKEGGRGCEEMKRDKQEKKGDKKSTAG